MAAPIKFYYDLLSQPSRALYIFLKSNKIPFEDYQIALRKGKRSFQLSGKCCNWDSLFRRCSLDGRIPRQCESFQESARDSGQRLPAVGERRDFPLFGCAESNRRPLVPQGRPRPGTHRRVPRVAAQQHQIDLRSVFHPEVLEAEDDRLESRRCGHNRHGREANGQDPQQAGEAVAAAGQIHCRNRSTVLRRRAGRLRVGAAK